MSLINKLFKKPKKEIVKPGEKNKPTPALPYQGGSSDSSPEKGRLGGVLAGKFKPSEILLFPLTTEKAVSGQSLNKYVFKVAPKANKIDIIKAILKTYNVEALSANIINIPRKARQIGKNKGFKSGYKKAVVTLAKGQSIEVK